jgi:AraC-like DNA-binding protein
VVEVHSRRLKNVLSYQEQDRCVAWAVDYLLDPRSEARFLNQQRRLGRLGALSRWGAPLDPRVLLLPEFAGLTEHELAAELGCSRSTIQRKKRELDVVVLTEEEAAELREHLRQIPAARAANKIEREEKRKAWLRRKARFVRNWKTRADRVRKAREHRFLVLLGWAGLTGFTGEVRVLRT